MDRRARLETSRLAALLLVMTLLVPLLAKATRSTDRFSPKLAVEMRFDPGLGVHLVRGHAGVYYFDRSYIRIHAGTWQFSRSASGPWRTRPAEWVPMGLRIKHYAEEL